jgi:2-oxoglutarate dehydrogenase E1 component
MPACMRCGCAHLHTPLQQTHIQISTPYDGSAKLRLQVPSEHGHAGLYALRVQAHDHNQLCLSCVQVRGVHDRVQDILNTEYEASRSYRPSTKDWLASHWQGFMSPAQLSRIRNTGGAVEPGWCVGRQQVCG